MTSIASPNSNGSMNEEKVTTLPDKRAPVDLQGNAMFMNKRPKLSAQETKEQETYVRSGLGEKPYGAMAELLTSVTRDPKIPSAEKVPEGAADLKDTTRSTSPEKKTKKTIVTTTNLGISTEDTGKSTSFPERLMELMKGEVAKEAIWWLPGGDAFALSPEVFPEKVLQKYFQGTKFESFTRKLNRWGFKRLAGQRVPANSVAYFHSKFQQGKPELLKDMRSGRQKDADLQDALLQQQLHRDLEAVGLAQAYGARNLGAAMGSPPRSSGAGLSLGGLGAGLSGLDTESLLARSLMQHQHQQPSNPLSSSGWGRTSDAVLQRQAQLLQSSRLEQELRMQSALGFNQNTDSVIQHQAALLQAEQVLSAQRLQQEQHQQLQQQLLGAGGFSSGLGSLADVPSSLLYAASQQQQQQQQNRLGSPGNLNSTSLLSSMGGTGTGNSSGVSDSVLFQLLLLEQQRKQDGGHSTR